MGLSWKKVKSLPRCGGVKFDGDPDAVSKRWFPIYWRFQHKWKILEVDNKVPGSEVDYHIYYKNGSACRVYRKALKSRFVGVRIGNQDIHFLAKSGPIQGIGFCLPIKDLGFYGYRSDLYTNDDPISKSLFLKALAEEIEWI